MTSLSADEIIRLLGLEPHPEGGHYFRTFRDAPGPDGREHSTAIYFLLKAGELSHWHRLDATELWHFYAGAALALRIVPEGQAVHIIRLGPDLAGGERPQAIVPAGAWQSAQSLGEWTLVGCTVAPGFRFEGFELAAEGWAPAGASIGVLPTAPIEIPLLTKTADDRSRLVQLLTDAQLRDPQLLFRVDPESGHCILAGVEEVVLDKAIGLIKEELGDALEIGAPQVAYRETITEWVEIDYTYKKVTHGAGQFARVMMRFEPAEPEGGFSFESKVAGGSVPENFIPAVRKGIETALRHGTLASMPVVNVRATLLDGRYHEVDSSVLAFEVAGRAAFREALQKGRPVLLEPIVEVDVTVPQGSASQVIGDLKSKRGELRQPKKSAGVTTISALVPLANMFGYINSLRAMGGKQASYSMRFSHYAAVPRFPDDDTFPPAIGMRA